jgi:beta-phosphoglucomutase-like phosphatase (HAD superfamily)
MKAVIFDMDGVISDTQSLAATIESEIFKEHGIDLSIDYITENYAGTKDEHMFKKEFSIRGFTADYQALSELKWKRITDPSIKINPIVGIHGLLDYCSQNGLKIALASGSPHVFINKVLTSLNLKDRFDAVCSADEVYHGKPAPDVFLLAAFRLDIHPSHCIVIEDGINGMIAARSAGMKSIGLVPKLDRSIYPADHLIHSLKDVPAILDSYTHKP